MTLQDKVAEILSGDGIAAHDAKIARYVSEVESRVLEFMKKTYPIEFSVDSDSLIYPLEGITSTLAVQKVFLNGIELPVIEHTVDIPQIGCYVELIEGVVNIEFQEACTGTAKVIVKKLPRKLTLSNDKSYELSLQTPYDTAYEFYTIAMINKDMKDYDGYNVNMSLYNAQINDFMNMYLRNKPRTYGHAKNYW